MAIINFKNLSTSGIDEDALTTSASGERVLNFGHLTTEGDLANGIFADADDVMITNFGGIETSGLGAAGIFVQGEDARIVNFWTVHTTGDSTDDFSFFSEGIFAEGDRFSAVKPVISVEDIGNFRPDPENDELFHAQRSLGAWVERSGGDLRLQVADCDDLARAFVGRLASA